MRSSELKEIEVIFFDLDDTLFDQQKAHEIALREINNRYDVFEEVDLKEITQAFKEADDEAIDEFRNGIPMEDLRFNRSEKVLKKLGVDEDFTETFHEEFYRLYPSTPVEIEGTKEVIEYLAPNYELGILSNSTEDIQMKKVRALNLTDYFDTLIFSEEVDSRKPDEGIFLHALDKVDKGSDSCLYVGNSYRSDIKGAKRVGMKTCWLNSDQKKKGDGRKPDLEIRNLRELLEIF